jgi:hypothetical protein
MARNCGSICKLTSQADMTADRQYSSPFLAQPRGRRTIAPGGGCVLTTNGTDEGVLRGWLDRELGHWAGALEVALDDAVEHLQALCFEDAWNDLAADNLPEAEINARVLLLYTEGLSDLLRFVRAAGAPEDDLAWSELKAHMRRVADESGAGAGAREALDDSCYTAESEPLGDHALYQAWARALMLFFFHFAATGPPYPGVRATEPEKLEWAYQALQPIEEHDQFHASFSAYLHDSGVRPVARAVLDQPVDQVLAFEVGLLEQRRFDLILNTGLHWLIGAVERA